MENNSTIYKRKSPLLLFLIPAFAFMALYLFYPFIMNIINSFQEIPNLGVQAEGMQEPFYANYTRLAQDPLMHRSFINTMILMVCTIVFQVGFALVLALLVDSIRRGAQFFRTVYFFPIVISATALGLLFNLIFNYNAGMVNQGLEALGLISEPIEFKDEAWWMFTMFTPVMWQYVGFYFVIMLTGLNNISPDIYEAAEIDGASGIQRVFRIKIPLLHNTLATCLTLAITGALKVFDLPWTMFYNGIPMDQSWLTGTYMYKQTMLFQDVDYGSAIAFFIVVLGVVISQLANAIVKEKDY